MMELCCDGLLGYAFVRFCFAAIFSFVVADSSNKSITLRKIAAELENRVPEAKKPRNCKGIAVANKAQKDRI